MTAPMKVPKTVSIPGMVLHQFGVCCAGTSIKLSERFCLKLCAVVKYLFLLPGCEY